LKPAAPPLPGRVRRCPAARVETGRAAATRPRAPLPGRVRRCPARALKPAVPPLPGRAR